MYKLIGPALVEQQLPEALKNVNERINFIETKLYVCVERNCVLFKFFY